MKSILVVGEYLPLVETRTAILARTGACVKHCSTRQLGALSADEEFDLIVLCHTVREDARCSIMIAVRQRWPFARIVQVFAGCTCPARSSGVDAYVPATEPARLIQWAAELLGKIAARAEAESLAFPRLCLAGLHPGPSAEY